LRREENKLPLPKFEYLKPEDTQEVTELLAEYGDEAKIFAGGTDLLLLMRDGVLKPRYLIDVKGIEELRRLSYDQQDGLHIGATTTLNQMIESDVVKGRFEVLWNASRSVADPLLRNRATLVGNICNASPAADTAPALLVLDAEVEVLSKDGERTVPIEEFFTGVKKTSMKPGEFVKAVRVPNPPKGARGGYLKWGRTRGEDLAIVGVGALIANSSAKLIRVALSSVAPTPIRIREVEKIHEEGGSLSKQIQKVAFIVQEKIAPITDVRSGKEYRRHMAGLVTRRLLTRLFEGS